MAMSTNPTDRPHTLTIRRGGQSYRGRWRVVEDAVHVTSPYGVNLARRGQEPPRVLAETLLGELAFRWSAQTRSR
jgi:hypothetical protein